MTTSSAPAYKAPDGFYKSYSFDTEGNVMADGKKLNGVRMDISELRKQHEGSRDFFNRPASTPFTGGGISRLQADEKGNVYAIVGEQNYDANTRNNSLMNPVQATKGPDGLPIPGAGNYGGYGNNQYGKPGTKIKLTGLAFDPARTSRNSEGELPDNNVYLREDREGLYFAQVDTKRGTAAYAYSTFQDKTQPVGGPTNSGSNNARKQGGNAGRGGAGFDTTPISLLGD